MKRVLFLITTIWWLGLGSGFCQDPNILIGLASPASGVTIKVNYPTGTSGWARGFKISNQDNSQPFIMLGTYGLYTNGLSTEHYSYIGKVYSNPYMTFLPSGNIGIGTTDPQAKLSVNGNILAREIKVKTNIAAPDYVFEPDYKLQTLAEIETYVKAHRHLPDIPSAKDIERDGLDLAEINLLLLRKVEELTLYLIEKEKIINNQQKALVEVNERLKKLEN